MEDLGKFASDILCLHRLGPTYQQLKIPVLRLLKNLHEFISVLQLRYVVAIPNIALSLERNEDISRK